MSKCRGEAERLGREAGARQQEMDALKLEVEELNGSLQSQQQQVGSGEGGGANYNYCTYLLLD